MNSEISKLVNKAKGDDRSLRQYANDSGVDVAVISKIIAGKYIPKKTDVYRMLTSQEASPRGGVTYKQLINALDSSRAYKEGVAAGVSTSEVALQGPIALMAMLGPMGAVAAGAVAAGAAAAKTITNKKKDTNQIDKYLSELQRFAAMTNGLILSELSEKDIDFKISKERLKELENKFDTYIEIKNQEIEQLIIRYAYLSEENQKNQYLVENTPRRMIEELVFLKASSKRKIMIVTNCKDSYDYLVSYRDNISYNGNLSVMLVDSKKAMLGEEKYISNCIGDSDTKD